MKQITNKFSKSLINELPRALFEGRIFVIQSVSEAEKAVKYLLTQPILGFDTETRPQFKKGKQNKVSLLQVSTHDTCFLFRLNLMGTLPACIRTLLEDITITKIGLSFHDDIRALLQRGKFTPGKFFDIQNEVKSLGIEDMSLQKIFANLFGQKIAKNQQLSNWDADVLNEAQQRYAATDAWACILLHEEICKLIETKEFTLIKAPEPNEENIS